MLKLIKELIDSASDVAVISMSNKTTAVGATTGVVGWLASVNWIGLAGIVIALAGLGVNIYFQRRRDRRETAESAERIQALRSRCEL